MTEPFCYRISRCGNCECALGKVGNTVMVLCQNPPKPALAFTATVTNESTGAEARVEDDDEAMYLVADRINGGRLANVDAWSEGKTLTVLFKDSGQLAKFRFVGLREKPSAADLRGEPE